MFNQIMSTAAGFGLTWLVCHIAQVDWQLALMAFYTATHGRYFVPEVELVFTSDSRAQWL